MDELDVEITDECVQDDHARQDGTDPVRDNPQQYIGVSMETSSSSSSFSRSLMIFLMERGIDFLIFGGQVEKLVVQAAGSPQGTDAAEVEEMFL